VSTILADSSLAEGFRYLMLTCIGRDAATEVAPTFIEANVSFTSTAPSPLKSARPSSPKGGQMKGYEG